VTNDSTVCLTVDLAPVREVVDSIEDLRRRWAALPPAVRQSLARLIWLRPDGEVVQYRAQEEAPCPSTR
jgi:hypothetical protein